jgi:hypothetical protein
VNGRALLKAASCAAIVFALALVGCTDPASKLDSKLNDQAHGFGAGPGFTAGPLGIVGSILNSGSWSLTGEQTYSTTGTSDNVVLSPTTAVFRYTGSGSGTITGFTGGTPGRVLIVTDESPTFNSLTLAPLTGSSAANQIVGVAQVNVQLPSGGGAFLRYDGSKWRPLSWATGIFNGQIGANLGISLGATLTGANANSASIVGNAAASTTVPTLIPDRSSATTGIGASSSGNISVIVGGVESLRFLSSNGIADFVKSLQGDAGNSFQLMATVGASATVPTLLPNKNSTTAGIGADASGDVSLITASQERVRIDSTGLATFFNTAVMQSAKNRGTITLSAGTGTVAVLSGQICACSDTTAVAAVKCAVSATTLTATGTGTDVIAYVCL